MNKSRYKLYKQGKKWVITAVAATSIGIGGYALTNPNLVHADTVQTFSLSSQQVVNDSEFYRMANDLLVSAKNDVLADAEFNYESFKAALAAYDIIKDIHFTVYNDVKIISKYATSVPSYLSANHYESLNTNFNGLRSSMMDAYYNHDNTSVLSLSSGYVNQVYGITNLYSGMTFDPVGSLASKDSLIAASATSAIGSVISSYNAFKNSYGHSASARSSSVPASSENANNSTPNKDASYWQNLANSLSAEMVKKSNANSVATVAPSSSTEISAASSTATSVTSSATSSAATSSSSTDGLAVSSRADDFLYNSYDSIANSSSASTSSAAKPKNDVYKNFYLSLKKKATKAVTTNQNRVNKYQKEYKITKNKQQKAKKLKQYRDAKHKLNVSQKQLKSLNTKSLK